MPQTIVDILRFEFEAIAVDLVRKYRELGLPASGRWARELEVDAGETSTGAFARLTGERYTEQLVLGRKPGRFPPVQAIEQWIIDKGIRFVETEIKLSSLAFIIARKIANEGTDIFQQGGTDLISSVITPQRIQSILDQVGEQLLEPIVSGLIQTLRSVSTAA